MTILKEEYTKEHQDNLIRRYREEGDTKALNELITSNDKFIHKVARQIFKKIGTITSYEDVYQESVVGFLVAMNSYDLDRGIKFLTYAFYQMRNHCNKVIYDNMHVVRLPSTPAKKKLMWSAGTISKKLRKEGKEFNLENVAAEMNVEPETLRETFNLLRSINYRISTPSDNAGDEEEAASDASFYAMYDDSPFRSEDYSSPYMKTYINELFALTQVFKNRLDQREQEIFEYRVLDLHESKTLQELAEQWNISMERVRQIQEDLERAFKLYSLNNIVRKKL